MKCLVLAAGYATRLYPLTENFPKPLLKVKGKTILDWLIEDIDKTGYVDEFMVITNSKFFHHFVKWTKNSPYDVTVIDDGTISNDNRLGAVKDIEFAIKKRLIDEDCLVIAGDNLLDFSFKPFIEYALDKNASCVMRYYETDKAKLQSAGVIIADESDKIIEMEEKPQEPKSNWCCPPFYYYAKQDIPLISKGIKSGCKTDAPGSFISWLCKNSDVYAYVMTGNRYDIGDVESYEEVQKTYKGIIK